VLSLAALLVLNKYIASSSFLKPFSQSHTLTNQKGYEAHHNQDLVSKEGLAFTVLRPSGKILIDGQYYDGLSIGEWIPKGEPIKVVGISGGIYTVVRIS
jgi:membrane-bound serine protease (ClpP class)